MTEKKTLQELVVLLREKIASEHNVSNINERLIIISSDIEQRTEALVCGTLGLSPQCLEIKTIPGCFISLPYPDSDTVEG